MTRSVFYGVGAFVGSITGPTTCAFWPDDPNRLGWNPAALVTVDLARNPEAVRRGTIQPADVHVDDFADYNTGGLTRIGPIFPGGAVLGLCYVEQALCAGLGASNPQNGARPYEWCTVVYYDGPMAGRRFNGFHAQIHRNTGNIALVSLWARGTSQLAGRPPMGTWWLDLGSFAHPVEPGLTQIGVTPGLPQTGALFLDTKGGGGGVSTFDSPKTPQWIGGAVPPRGHRVR